jgi:predicted secreted protein
MAAVAAVATVAVLAMAATPAAAGERDESMRAAHGPQATLSAQASSVVPQDTVQIILATEVTEATQTAVAEALNEVLEATMKDAKGHEGIEARSGSYRIWPSTRRDSDVIEWWGHGEIILTSMDFAAAAKLASQLDDRMPIGGMSFSVSEQRRSTEENALIERAVQAFKARAQALTQALGFESYRYRTIELGGGGAQFQPMPRMMMSAMAEDKAAAPVEGGTETVTVSVNGTIWLLPASK